MRLDERGKQCPLPVIEAKKALEKAEPGTIVEVVVDNEIAVQNLKKLASHKGLESTSERISSQEFVVSIQAGTGDGPVQSGSSGQSAGPGKNGDAGQSVMSGQGAAVDSGDVRGEQEEGEISCQPDIRDNGMVVVLSSDQMGQGDETLGRLLMKGFVYALTKQDKLPGTVLLYNGGARLSCQGSDSLEDLKELQAQGVEILTCGTCLNHYGLGEKLAVGAVTNMYEIAERMSGAGKLVRP